MTFCMRKKEIEGGRALLPMTEDLNTPTVYIK